MTGGLGTTGHAREGVALLELAPSRPLLPCCALSQVEWSMSLEQAIETEAQAQAICMQTRDFRRAYDAFVAKGAPLFEGN